MSPELNIPHDERIGTLKRLENWTREQEGGQVNIARGKETSWTIHTAKDMDPIVVKTQMVIGGIKETTLFSSKESLKFVREAEILGPKGLEVKA